jgi:glycosyltransferase involved in cell wall biosynthesis
MPLISILTPVYNASAYIEELILSVQAQTFTDYEHILIDDGSNDQGATISILRKHKHIKWWSRENKGQYYTQNELLLAATGKYVTFISADDLYSSSTALSKIHRKIIENPNAEIIYGRTSILRMTDVGCFLFDPHAYGKFAFAIEKYCPTVQHCSLFIQKEYLLKHNLYFDPEYRLRGDLDWILRLTNTAEHFVFVSEQIAIWRHHNAQTSRTKYELGVKETIRVCHKYRINYALHKILRRAWAVYGIMVAVRAYSVKFGIIRTVKRAYSRIGTYYILVFDRNPKCL